jgi:hypothetical protein
MVSSTGEQSVLVLSLLRIWAATCPSDPVQKAFHIANYGKPLKNPALKMARCLVILI